ncbi:YesL family protein [Microbacterium yannicii]|uniref:YesL family protein n=1 Tax=Microbacterium yannicii TaxID=671622 RepID=A0ABP9LY48_9MICO|nr:YesL family protein [Microbacterium yannicii]MCO5954395.1 YesL family protein [Microbacterium yannicii]
MRIDPDSRTLGGFSTFLTFVALNLLYIVLCLPIVTIGAATSALYEVTIRYSDDESGRPLKDFFPAFRTNFGRATVLMLCLLAPAALLGFSSVFWFAHPALFAGVAGVVAVIGAVYLFAAFLYAMAQVAYFRNTVGQTLKNALLLPAAEPVRTLGVLIIPVTAVAMMILFPPAAILVGTIGFSVGAYATAFLFRNVFTRHLA